eukprot:2472953-Pleurochrysis_carterae.AAC.2
MVELPFLERIGTKVIYANLGRRVAGALLAVAFYEGAPRKHSCEGATRSQSGPVAQYKLPSRAAWQLAMASDTCERFKMFI